MVALLIISHHNKNKEFGLFLLVTYFAGFFIEVLGVSTGFIFGVYTYGETLGIKLADVPLMIGVNWIILIYCTGISIKYLKIRNHLVRATLGSLFLVILDILIEPVAIRFNYWSWDGMNIPFQNYVAWFVFSFCMLMFFFARKFRKNNPAAIIMLVSQTVFFLILNWLA
ncbi:MAG: carotenoid biosynthesis protein [Flavobacterium sp.]|nr:carotenoid biosynthesis protein [Pedobacter sp.]